MWKRGPDFLTLNDRFLLKNDDPRFKLEREEGRGNTLVISLAEPDDAGEYICQVSSADRPTELKHVVRIRGE